MASPPASPQSIVFAPSQLAEGLEAFPFDLRVLAHTDDCTDVFKLRHVAYVRDGLIPANRAGSVSDDGDRAAEAVQVAAYHDGRCVGSFRMTFKGWTDPVSVLPCAPHYPALQSAGLRKLSMAEISAMIIDPALTNRTHRTALYGALVRAGLIAGQVAHTAMLLVTARPEWVRFYTHLLRFHVIGAPARYPPANVELTLLGGNLAGAGARHIARSRFFHASPAEFASMRSALARALNSSPYAHSLGHSAGGA